VANTAASPRAKAAANKGLTSRFAPHNAHLATNRQYKHLLTIAALHRSKVKADEGVQDGTHAYPDF
jgi:hypothetical protein